MWLRSSTVIAVGVILLVSCCEIGESKGGGGRGGSRGGSRGVGGGGSYSGSGGSGYTGSARRISGLILSIVALGITICIGCVCFCNSYKKKAIRRPANTTGTVINTPRQVYSGARGAHHLSHIDIQPPPQYSANGYHTRPPPYKARDSISSVTHQSLSATKLTSPRTHGVPPSRHEHGHAHKCTAQHKGKQY